MADHLRFTQDAIALRKRSPPSAPKASTSSIPRTPTASSPSSAGSPARASDVVVVASLSESTWYNYQLGFPSAGRWDEVFNSDAYDSCNANRVLVNPQVAGNNGGIDAYGPPLHNLPASASITIPANSVLVFAKA